MKTIFVSYAHADFFWLDYILWPFKHMKESGKVHFYVDREQLDAGSRFEEELSNYIARADAFLILVGRDYLQSKFVRENEWPRILARLPNAKLFWIPLRPDYRTPGPDDPSEICTVLSNHQTAYGTPKDFFENRSDLAKREALLQFESQVRRWLNSIDSQPKSAIAPAPLSAPFDAELKEKYLKFLQGYYGDIRIGSLGTKEKRVPLLPLSEVYITLSVDTTTLDDRRQTRYLYDELAEEENDEWPGQEKGDVIAKILQQRGHRLPEPLREGADEGAQTFENTFARERVLVILGDPGSGKSVLCRWIAFQMSQHQGPEVSSENAWLGVPRLPILIRTARFAEYVKDLRLLTGQELLDFLGQHTSEIQSPFKEDLTDQKIGELCKQEITNGRAVVILDGLDEVGKPALRRQVSQAIELFISRCILNGQVQEPQKRLESQGLSGNQIVITSRVTGYHLAPLPLECASHFRIRPLDKAAVEQLSRRMGQALDDDEVDSGIGDRFYERVESRSATNPAIASLKCNPLLLTSMFVYFVRNNSELPTSRAELYERLVLDLSANWRLRGDEREEALVLAKEEDAAWQKLHQVLFENQNRGVLKLLCEIARFIHDTGTGGRIARPALRSLMGRLLAPLFTIKKTESGQSFAGTCADLLLRIT